MIITSAQLRAARGLLDWTRSELAKAAGLSPETIKNIEHGLYTPQEATVKSIIETFTRHDVEFLENEGVRRRDDAITVIEGEDCYPNLLDEVRKKLKGHKNAEAFFFFVDNSKSNEKSVAAHRRLRESGVHCRYLCEESPKRLDFDIEDYRAIKDRFFHNAVQVVFGDYVALAVSENPPRAIVIKSIDLAEAQRRIFEILWLTFPQPILEHEE